MKIYKQLVSLLQTTLLWARLLKPCDEENMAKNLTKRESIFFKVET